MYQSAEENKPEKRIRLDEVGIIQGQLSEDAVRKLQLAKIREKTNPVLRKMKRDEELKKQKDEEERKLQIEKDKARAKAIALAEKEKKDVAGSAELRTQRERFLQSVEERSKLLQSKSQLSEEKVRQLQLAKTREEMNSVLRTMKRDEELKKKKDEEERQLQVEKDKARAKAGALADKEKHDVAVAAELRAQRERFLQSVEARSKLP